ncbi:hypothetical protein L1887_29632 [Cichorium endivia]|nr:hypothetical protein L1887_29632 [Cichorium endivia]
MTSPIARVTFRTILAVFLFLFLFYVGRPLYWKISATVHDIQQNKQTVSGGFSEIVLEAQKSVGWYHDESDSGVRETIKTARRMLIRKAGMKCWELDICLKKQDDIKASDFTCLN